MKERLISLWLLPLVICLSGCLTAPPNSKKVSVDLLLKLQGDLSQEQVEKILGTRARHEFSASFDDNLVRCVSFGFKERGRYYFLFTNDSLAKICELPHFEFKRTKRRSEYPDLSDPEGRTRKVYAQPHLSGAALSESLQRRVPRPKPIIDNATPAFVIAAPIWLITAPFRAGVPPEIKTLATRFDPFQAKLGMSVEQVEAMFGEPHVKESWETNAEIRYYGSPKLGADSLLWVSVAFKDGHAVRVFSNNFFDMQKIYPKKDV